MYLTVPFANGLFMSSADWFLALCLYVLRKSVNPLLGISQVLSHDLFKKIMLNFNVDTLISLSCKVSAFSCCALKTLVTVCSLRYLHLN